MKRKKGSRDSVAEFEKGIKEAERIAEKEEYVLRLYVTGMTIRSKQAIQNIKKICQEHLGNRYDLEVIDVYRQPVLAKGDQIIATPTLIKKLPAPIRKFIGDMSETEKILMGLDLQTKK